VAAMALVREIRPRGPYSLALTARHAGDATRRLRDGMFDAVVRTEAGLARAAAVQRPDGTMVFAGGSEEGIEALRWTLAVDDDHSEFLLRFADDPLLGRATRELRGLRIPRVGTVAQALLRALCGQLITSSEARRLERHIVRATAPVLDGLCAAPTAGELARLGPAQLRALGLHARRAATLVRLCRAFDLERLKAVPTAAAAERLARERGLGPWSVSVISVEGLGRPGPGLVGDLGLIKLQSALRGRWVDAAETAVLLEPYGEWGGLASAYLLLGWARGLVPLPERARPRLPPPRFRRAAA
jgi:3-methyladenine DNA glycosylase/8-oxoguanine DNA glycosylase